MNKRGSTEWLCVQRTPHLYPQREWHFDTYAEGTEPIPPLFESLSISSWFYRMSFMLKVESNGKTPCYLHKSAWKVILIPVLETHVGNWIYINLQGFLSSAWEQHLPWQPRQQWPNQPLHNERHCSVSANPSQSFSLGVCIIPWTA